jgi:hypothetical protein
MSISTRWGGTARTWRSTSARCFRLKPEVGRNGGQSSDVVRSRRRHDARQPLALPRRQDHQRTRHVVPGPRIAGGPALFGKQAPLEVADRRGQPQVRQLSRPPEQGEHPARDEQLDDLRPPRPRVSPVPGRRGIHQVERALAAKPLERGDHRLDRQSLRRPREQARHFAIPFQRGDLTATRCEQPSRLSGPGADLEHCGAAYPQHSREELVRIPQPVALTAVGHRRTPARRRTPQRVRRALCHGPMNIRALCGTPRLLRSTHRGARERHAVRLIR